MTTNPTAPGEPLTGHALFVEARKKSPDGQMGLFARTAFRSGTRILSFYPENIYTEPSRETVQVGFLHHISLQPKLLQYTNHSCDPNIFFDTTLMQIVALKDIAEGDELRFFYPATEWKMREPFQCNCGSANCLGEIRGAAYLSSAVAAQYQLNSFISERTA